MNDEGNVRIPHGPQAEETPNEAPNFSSEGNSTPEVTPEQVVPTPETEISHEEPIETDIATNAIPESPNTMTAPTQEAADTEPVDILATQNEQSEQNTQSGITEEKSHINNNPFSGRNRYQEKTPQPAVPQFFNDAIVANTPIEQPKSNKKGLLIGAGIGVIVVAIIALVAIFALRNNNTPVNSGLVDIDGNKINVSSKNIFYSYANYALFGQESEDKLPERNSDQVYSYSSKIFPSKELDVNYAKSLLEKYNTFYNKLRSDNPNSSKGVLFSKTDDYKKLLEFTVKNPSNEKLDYSYIASIYVSGGEDAATKAITDVLTPFYDEENSYSLDFYEQKTTEFNLTINYMKKIKSANCIVGGKINDTCAEKVKALDSDGNSILETLTQTNSNIYNSVSDSYRHIGLDCFEIGQILEGNF